MSTLLRELIATVIAFLTVGALIETQASALVAGSKIWAKPSAGGNRSW